MTIKRYGNTRYWAVYARPQGEESHTPPCGLPESLIGHSTPGTTP
jgi:hypothetical protein